MMRKNSYIAPAVAIFIALLLISPVLYIKSKNKSHSIATIDLQLLVEEKQQQLLTGTTLTEQQRLTTEKSTVEFAKKLSRTIDAISQECQCVIINKAAILGGNPVDYTARVREKMQS